MKFYLKRTIAKFWLLTIAFNAYAFSTLGNVTLHAGSDNSYTLPVTRGETGQFLTAASDDDYSVLAWMNMEKPMMLFETVEGPASPDFSVDTVIGVGNIPAWGCTIETTTCVISEDVTLRVCWRYHDDNNSNGNVSGYVSMGPPEDIGDFRTIAYLLAVAGKLGGATTCTIAPALAGEEVSISIFNDTGYPDGSLQQITIEQLL